MHTRYFRLLLAVTLLLTSVTAVRRLEQRLSAPSDNVALVSSAAQQPQRHNNLAAQASSQPSALAAGAAVTSAAAAQKESSPRAGGRFVQAVSIDADTFNPVLTTNSTSLAVLRKIYPVLIDQDPTSGMPAVGWGLAQKWDFAPNNEVVTLTLRTDVLWSDHVPVTADDVRFTLEAIRTPAVASPYREHLTNVAAITTPDAAHVVLHLQSPDCTILQDLQQPLLPSHLFAPDFGDLRTNPLNVKPTVGAGPFLYSDHTLNDHITLVRNDTYWDNAPLMERWEYRVIPDSLNQLQALTNGNVDWLKLAASQVAPAQRIGGVALFQSPADSLIFLALNLADPTQVQPGRDVNDQLAPQTPHPILGDLKVRKAIALGVDYAHLLDEVYGAAAFRLGSYLLPTVNWAYADLPPSPYDVATARQLLESAGWRDRNGDGVRDRQGVALQLTLLTNTDSEERIALATLIQHQLQALGFAINFDALSFDTVADQLLAQRYDMVLIGWDNLGADPASSDFWHSRYDVPGSGANFVSYQNPQVDEWLDRARTLPGCETPARGALYRNVQEQIYRDLPYILIGGELQSWAYQRRWQGIQPGAWRFDYNVQRWWLAGQ
ncbi:MAG: ABC transporter substrate-binding protein [Caldilineaceae bacterium]